MHTSIGRARTPDSLKGACRVAERIASHGFNNLYRTSCYFADPGRYTAFCAFYAVMRLVDDRVDDFLAQESARGEKAAVHKVVDAWHAAVKAACAGRSLSSVQVIEMDHPAAEDLHGAFSDAYRSFPTPTSLWDDFFSSMHQDLERVRFASYDEFVRYAKGAAIAPATIYLYLISAEKDASGVSHRPPADFRLSTAGHKLGLFAYVAHILRDLAPDLRAGGHTPVCLAGDDMAEHGLTESALYSDLASGSSSESLRSLIRELVQRAQTRAREGRDHLQCLKPRLSPDRAFVLEFIVRIYEETIKRIILCDYDIMSGRHVLTDSDKIRTAKGIADDLGLELGDGRPMREPAGIGDEGPKTGSQTGSQKALDRPDRAAHH